MKCTIRGVLVFLSAFLLGSAAVPAPQILDVPPVADEVMIATPPPAARYHKPLPAPADVPAPQFTIEIRRRVPESELEERSIKVKPAGPRVTDLHLELGETIENQLIVLHPAPRQKFEYKIEQQFETSMAIGDEGPHYDLIDWKHHTSPWEEISEVSTNRFVTSKLSEADYSRFPKVTRDDIVSAFKKDGATGRWLELARTCTGPGSGPCYVSVSRISFRISVKNKNTWKPVHTINFAIPMGC